MKSVKVKYVKNGFVGYANEKAAELMQKKGAVKILGEVKEEEQKKEEPKKGK